MISLETHGLAGALLAEMRQAMEAIEAGDYTGAHGLLAARCAPDDADPAPLAGMPSLAGRRAGQRMLELMPHGAPRSLHKFPFQLAAEALGRLLAADPAALKPEDFIVASQLAGDYAICLAWDFQDVPTPITQEP